MKIILKKVGYIMVYNNYNKLLKPSSLDNFQKSLDCPNGYIFNSLVNLFTDEQVKFEITEGYNNDSKDEKIKYFNKISFKFQNLKEIENILKNYELDGIFNIYKDKNIYTFITV